MKLNFISLIFYFTELIAATYQCLKPSLRT